MGHMQTIPDSYRQASQTLKLIKREGNAAMYGTLAGDYFEVHKVRVAKPREIFGKAYPEREILASDEDFGTYGWACVGRERAEARFADVPA